MGFGVYHLNSAESHTGSTGSVSEASFSFTGGNSPTVPRGVVVFVFNLSSGTDTVTSVTYGGIPMIEVPGGFANDTAAEPGFVKSYFLGTGIPSGAQTIVVNRTNNTDIMYAVQAVVDDTSGGAGYGSDTEVTGVVVQNEDGTLAAQSINDGSVSGQNSQRYAAVYSGLSAPAAAASLSTVIQSIDVGANWAGVVRETTPGIGARNVGFSSGTTDDRAAVYLAIREVLIPPSPSGAPFGAIGQDQMQQILGR